MSKLLEMMFEHARWEDLIVKADDKGINLGLLKQLCIPEIRVDLYNRIVNRQYDIAPPHIARIPKDKPGEFREVYVNEDIDRIVLTLINDCLCELFTDLIHPQCKSYQKGIGCQEVVQNITKEIAKLDDITNQIGYKADLSKYFDSVDIGIIDYIFDTLESRLGYDKETEPVIYLLRKYYHNDWVFDIDCNLVQHYGSLKQGCAVASFLANVVLYSVDDTLSRMDIIYYRYSDDIVMIGDAAEVALHTLEEMLRDYGLKLNPDKVEPLFKDKWFKFLGFNIKGTLITLSKNRVKRFQKEIEARTIRKKNITAEQARRSVIQYLYSGDMSWASSCLGTVNCQPDLEQMNNFIMDCLRAVATGKKKIGGLGVVMDLPDRTILRGTGKNVASNRAKTNQKIENYFTMTCLANAMKINKSVYNACVRSM